MRTFCRCVALKEEDLILLTGLPAWIFAVLCWREPASSKLAMVFHSEHEFSKPSQLWILCNVFKYAKRFDYFITATDLQKKSWSRRLLNKDAKGIQSIYSGLGI